MSPFSRRAWIEMISQEIQTVKRKVALLAEGVDRNARAADGQLTLHVALLAEGVDRNSAIGR